MQIVQKGADEFPTQRQQLKWSTQLNQCLIPSSLTLQSTSLVRSQGFRDPTPVLRSETLTADVLEWISKTKLHVFAWNNHSKAVLTWNANCQIYILIMFGAAFFAEVKGVQSCVQCRISFRLRGCAGKQCFIYIDHLMCISASGTHPPPFHVLYCATTQGVFLRAGFSLCSTWT